jgi:hypothetical protein
VRAGVSHRAGDEDPLWLLCLHTHGRAVVAEGPRGIFRLNGVVVRWSAEPAETLRQYEGK